MAAAVVTVLASCSAIGAGYVTAKHYTAPYDNTVMECKVWKPSTKNNPMSCMIWGNRVDHYDATFKLDLKNEDKTGWVYVGQKVYDSTKVGDWYGKLDG